MDWLYVWAYHRIADRGSKRAEDVSAQLATLASQQWLVRTPGLRGRGTFGAGVWGTYPAWQSAGVKQPRNFFSSEKNLVKKLKDFAKSPALAEVQRSFTEVFASEKQDVAALKALGWSLDGLCYRGVVVVGWGAPKGVAWIGLCDAPDVWRGTPEERAIELFFPERPFTERPACAWADARFSQNMYWDRDLHDAWGRLIPHSLIGSVGFTRVDDDLCNRDDERAFILVQPKPDDVTRVRVRQFRGEFYPLLTLRDGELADGARYLPWLWSKSAAWGGTFPVIVTRRFGTVFHAYMVVAALRNFLDSESAPLDDAGRYWHARGLSDWGSLISDIRRGGFLWEDRAQRLRIRAPIFFELNEWSFALWRDVAEWVLADGSPDYLRGLAKQTTDTRLALRANERLWRREGDRSARGAYVRGILLYGNPLLAEQELVDDCQELVRIAREAIAETRPEDTDRLSDLQGLLAKYSRSGPPTPSE